MGETLMESWFHFLLLGLALSTPVGPANLEMIKLGMNRGFYLSWLVGLGDVFSNLFFMLILLYGVSDWLAHEWVRAIFSIIGGLFLIQLGLRSNLTISLLSVSFPDPVSAMVKGFCLGLINPSDLLSWLGIYSSISQQSIDFIWSAFAWLLIGSCLWNSLLSFVVSHCRHFVNPTFLQIFMRGASLLLAVYGASFLIRGVSHFIFSK
jgi:threonine/homoserine/homoserine lactone efflux protein